MEQIDKSLKCITSMTMPLYLFTEVRDRCEEERVSRSAWISQAIAERIARLEKKEIPQT